MEGQRYVIWFSQSPVILSCFVFLLTLPFLHSVLIDGELAETGSIVATVSIALVCAYAAITGVIIRLTNKYAFIVSEAGLESWCHGKILWSDIVDFNNVQTGRQSMFNLKVKDVKRYNNRSFLCPIPTASWRGAIIINATFLSIEPEEFERMIKSHLSRAAKT